jgi:transcriptional regulator with XRE-family HTH domain
MVSVDTRKTFWTRLVEAWDAQGLPSSQLGIAKVLNMSQGSVGRWARGEGVPELERVREIALRGKVSVEWLLTGRGPKQPIMIDEETGELLALWEQLQPNGRHSVRVAAQGALALQENPVRLER